MTLICGITLSLALRHESLKDRQLTSSTALHIASLNLPMVTDIRVSQWMKNHMIRWPNLRFGKYRARILFLDWCFGISKILDLIRIRDSVYWHFVIRFGFGIRENMNWWFGIGFGIRSYIRKWGSWLKKIGKKVGELKFVKKKIGTVGRNKKISLKMIAKKKQKTKIAPKNKVEKKIKLKKTASKITKNLDRT